MLCQECNFEITSQMTHAVRQNSCPACGAEIMSAAKMQQYRQLRQVLVQNQLTNNPAAEVKLREKLIALILQHFELTLVQAVEVDTDLVDLDGGEEQTIKVEADEAAFVVPLDGSQGGGGSPRRIMREGSQVQDGKHQLPEGGGGGELDQMRREVYSETYGEQQEGVVLRDTETGDEIDLEEAKEFFPGHENEVGTGAETEGETRTAEEQVQSLQEIAKTGKGSGRFRRVKQ